MFPTSQTQASLRTSLKAGNYQFKANIFWKSQLCARKNVLGAKIQGKSQFSARKYPTALYITTFCMSSAHKAPRFEITFPCNDNYAQTSCFFHFKFEFTILDFFFFF